MYLTIDDASKAENPTHNKPIGTSSFLLISIILGTWSGAIWKILPPSEGIASDIAIIFLDTVRLKIEGAHLSTSQQLLFELFNSLSMTFIKESYSKQ